MIPRTITRLFLGLSALAAPLSAQTTPEIEAGLNWLQANANPDGSWGQGSEAEVFRHTVESAGVLLEQRPATTDAGAARRWLERIGPTNVESAAGQGRLAALEPVVNFVPNYRLADYFRILSEFRNPRDSIAANPNAPEGGWGLAEGFSSDTLDTVRALRVFSTAGPVGLVITGQAINNAQTRQFTFDLPSEATAVVIKVTSATATIDVRVSHTGPPTLADPYFRITATPVNLNVTAAGPGRNFLRVDGLGTGSFGISVGYETAAFDGEAWSEGLAYLLACQNPDGGWGLQKGESSCVFATTAVLAAIDDSRNGFASSTVLNNGAAWLASQQNPDGGFGEPRSTVPETAAAYQALSAHNLAGAPATTAKNRLLAIRNPAGHWNLSPLDTACAVRALRFSLRNLDTDVDGVPDIFDNCLSTPNADQIDTDGDHLGNACDSDDDGDGLTDSFEAITGTDPLLSATLGNGLLDGDLDLDLDGKTNAAEQIAGTDPNQPNLTLKRGLNLFTYPLETVASFSAFDLLAELGGSTVVERVLKYQPTSGQYLEAHYSGSTATGSDFTIAGGDGMMLYLKTDRSQTFTGTVSYRRPDLNDGPNLVRFPDIIPGETSQDLFLNSIPLGDMASIQRYQPDFGRFQTATTEGSSMVGPVFDVFPSETYLVHMSSARPRFVITYPAANATVTSSPLTVTGEIGPNVTSVMVNGVVATLGTGTFSAPGVTLVAGPNIISAAAFAGPQNFTSLKFTVNLGNAADFTFARGTSVTGSRQFSAPVGSAPAFYYVTLSGLPYDSRAIGAGGERTGTASQVHESRHCFAVVTGKAILLEERADVSLEAHRAVKRLTDGRVAKHRRADGRRFRAFVRNVLACGEDPCAREG